MESKKVQTADKQNVQEEWSKELFYKPTAVSRTNTELDRHSKDSKKDNPVPENQPESSERRPADKKGLRASQLWKNRF